MAIRARSGLNQRAFAQRFGVDLRALLDWEPGRRRPTRSVASYLRVIDRAPEAVAEALGAPSAASEASPQPPQSGLP